mmetsp:Transcript_62775/g.177056  ORF Transcript_62775/g.177056 Transcript_62775/m.177056 type:complete len:280 (-) Transcript_62775:113-952(-)|eukprot:CAMPEP_0179257736 /NCGR_PEP_ID=MMETSP0797-20121207/24946_1 /TAXON_ID=47934 /ORGANISM="Dinophysis acuminata, Strain DAEP01" /LENGTH=279 /DNA_ID=CAMNT_0020965731 /DNA_START=51 /DNA_END=890 /DNA_ORIENTATION=-
MASGGPHRQVLKDCATLSELEDALVNSGDPLELSAVDPEELTGLKALVELVVFAWRTGSKSIYERLRQAGGCRAYMADEFGPVLSVLPAKLKGEVEAVGPLQGRNPSAWRKGIISIIVRHGFPEAILNEVLATSTPKKKQGNDNDVAAPAPAAPAAAAAAAPAAASSAAKRVARAAPLAGRIRRMGKGRKMSVKRDAARDGPLHRLKRALKTQFDDNPKPSRRLTLKGIIDGMDTDDLARATDMCLRLNSQLAQALVLCFNRRSDEGSAAAATDEGTAK